MRTLFQVARDIEATIESVKEEAETLFSLTSHARRFPTSHTTKVTEEEAVIIASLVYMYQ